jgi:hypothetical protein
MMKKGDVTNDADDDDENQWVTEPCDSNTEYWRIHPQDSIYLALPSL